MERLQRWMAGRYWPLCCALLAVGLSAQSLGFGFLLDDYLHRGVLKGLVGASPLDMYVFVSREPGQPDVEELGGGLPWWSSEHLHLAFWRPLSSLTHWVDYALWPDTPWVMHLHNLFWYAVLVVLVGLLYRRIGGAGWVAGLAVLMYAVDDARAWPVMWIANRNALVSTVFVVAALIAHDRWRRDDVKWGAAFAMLFFTLGLLSKESALAAFGYIVAYAAFLDRASLRARIASVTPYVAIVVLWRGVYSLRGYGAAGSEMYIDPLVSPLRFVAAILIRVPFFLTGQLTVLDSEAYFLAPPPEYWGLWLFALALCAVLLLALWPLLRERRAARFWAAGMVLSIIPSCAAFPSNRMLFAAGLGGMALVAQYLAEGPWRKYKGSALRILGAAVFWFFIATHLVVAPLSLPLRAWGTAKLMEIAIWPAKNFAYADEIRGKTVIIVDDPLIFSGAFLTVLGRLEGDPGALRIHSLASLTMVPAEIHLRREDANTLLVDLVRGIDFTLFRGYAEPFSVGDVVVDDGMTVVVETVTARGAPMRVRVSFDVPLEDESLFWLEYKDATLWPFVPPEMVPFTLPAIGETIVLNRRE